MRPSTRTSLIVAIVLSLVTLLAAGPGGAEPRQVGDVQVGEADTDGPVVVDEPVHLKDVAPAGLLVGGAATGYDPTWYRGGYAALANRQFSAMTSMTYMAYNGWLDPAAPIDTAGHERMVRWSQKRGKQVHGHVLVYPLANQDLAWFQNTAIDHEAVLQTYVNRMARSTAGKVWVWDVVNEVMADPGDSRVDGWGLRNDYIEYTEIGPDYVDKAFAWAKAADPAAQLIINDYGAETINTKSDRLLAYVNELRRRGVPVDGVGFQMHIIGTSEPDYASIAANFQRFADAGFDLYITEMDVSAHLSPTEFPLPGADDLARQRRIYQTIAGIAADQPAMKSLLFWDYADERSWLNPTDRPLGSVPPGTWTYPTPFSGGDTVTPEPKPAFFGLVEGLAGGDTLTPGRYRLRPGWGAGRLTRLGTANGAGGFDPSNQVRLQGLNLDWSSQVWLVEAVGDGSFRIRNDWDPATGYLARIGGVGTAPAPRVRLEALDVTSSAQRWTAESTGDGAYRLRSALDGSTGYLSRRGKPGSNGTFRPINKVELTTQDPGLTAQHWYLEPAG